MIRYQSKYNIWFKEMLLKHFAGIEYEISTKCHDDTEYAFAQITHPTNADKNIYISSLGLELTFFFWMDHSHFDHEEERDQEEDFKDLVEYVKAVISDEMYFSAAYRGDTIVSTMSSDNIEQHRPTEGTKAKIVNWSGSADQEICG